MGWIFLDFLWIFSGPIELHGFEGFRFRRWGGKVEFIWELSFPKGLVGLEHPKGVWIASRFPGFSGFSGFKMGL